MNKNILHIGPTENKTIFNILSASLKLGVYVSHSQLGKQSVELGCRKRFGEKISNLKRG